MNASKQMKAMRVHDASGRFQADTVPLPALLRPTDVLVEVKASGVVPNLRNVISHYGERSYLTLPDLPAIFGLDTAGVVVTNDAERRFLEKRIQEISVPVVPDGPPRSSPG